MADYGKNPVRLVCEAANAYELQARYNTVEAVHELLITREGNARVH
jgi:hypothetical protein